MSKSVSTIPEVSPDTPEQQFDRWRSQTDFLQGRVLTIIDASYTDPVQRKAVKDLVRQQFQEQTKWVYEIMTGGRMIAATGEQMRGSKNP